MPVRPDYVSVNRHGTYYFRIVIPTVLRPLLGSQREIRRSLKTDSLRLALRRARQYAGRYQSAFDKVLDVVGKDEYEPTDEDLAVYLELLERADKPDQHNGFVPPAVTEEKLNSVSGNC